MVVIIFVMQQSDRFLRLPNVHGQLQVEHSPPQTKEIDTRWVQIKFAQSFTPRSYFASCIQAGNIYVHGGFSAQTGILKDLLSCCLYEHPARWKKLQARNQKQCEPGTLRNHTLTSYLSQLILVGGQRNVIINNELIYRFDLLSNTWSICKCTDSKGRKFPYALDSHSTLLHKNHLYVLSGYDSHSTEYLTKIIKISLEKVQEDVLTYQILNPGERFPSPRGNTSCCLAGNEIYLFGGGNVEDVYGDFWSWDIEKSVWSEIKPEDRLSWPDRRKGGSLVLHSKSHCLFLFGGIKKVTKEQNDVLVFMITRKRWVKIHSNTNELYDPSPTLKELAESPTIAEEKRKRERDRIKTTTATPNGSFKLDNLGRMHETNIDFMKRDLSKNRNETTVVGDFKRKMSVVQEKKYRQFLTRKKKLLSNIESGYESLPGSKKRSHSPTSQALIFSLNCMGEQSRNEKADMHLPKVIYDEEKGQVIGKKPCARDGHAGLLHEECMIILGGDRHMVSFNDAYMFKLDKGVESLPHYE